MAADITVTGTLTRDPDIKYAQSGTPMLKLARRNWESGAKSGVALEVRFPKLLGYVKKADKAGGVQALAPTTSNTFSAPF